MSSSPPSSTSTGPTTFSAASYFTTQLPPPTLSETISHVRDFIARQSAIPDRKVVLVTSGGTTVPLELNVVRFLDNFSAGTRGSTSAEYFLQHGYSVIFMHRQFSLQPFSRHYSHSTNPFLDFLNVESSSIATETDKDTITVKQAEHTRLASVLKAYKAVHDEGRLHSLTFVTVNDYLWLLRAVSQEMSVLRRRSLYYLAAAVSDFFLPSQKMSEHKIQSGKGSLSIEMDQVPKILKPLVDEWTRDGFIVSFKLETDPALLIPKAQGALERYKHNVVVGNDLHRRKFEVVFVERHSVITEQVGAKPIDSPNANERGEGTSTRGEFTEQWLTLTESDLQAEKEIEEDIVRELVKRHEIWINRA